MSANEIRCPKCGASRFTAIGNIIDAGPLFAHENCHRCGFVFTYIPVAA